MMAQSAREETPPPAPPSPGPTAKSLVLEESSFDLEDEALPYTLPFPVSADIPTVCCRSLLFLFFNFRAFAVQTMLLRGLCASIFPAHLFL
jgi:hypothetical protein